MTLFARRRKQQTYQDRSDQDGALTGIGAHYIALGLFPRQRRIDPGRVAWRASEVRTRIDGRPEK
jgi:hypothetical protein